MQEGVSHRQLVLGVGALLVAAQVGFRSWVLYPSWFYADDYRLLLDARARTSPDWQYLTTPFDSHVMPAGRLLAWLVAESGTTNWALAATLTLLFQAVAGLACLWMLTVLFGDRWSVLLLLSLYLTSAVAVPAFVWWAASLNQVPPQATFFIAVACWVRYLRDRRMRSALGTWAAVAVGLLFDVRAVLVVPVLVLLTVIYFSTGGLTQRLVSLRRQLPGLALGGALVASYVAYYVAAAPAPFESGENADPLGLADSMLATTAATGLVGGPWRWLLTNPPIVLAQPPSWTVHLTWLVIAAVAAVGWLRRRRSAGGWVLLVTQAGLLFALLATTRGRIFGPIAGLEYRYLTELAVVLPLCLGLVFLELREAPGSSAPRDVPLLTRPVPRWLVVATVVVVCGGGVASSVQYVDYWHHQNANRDYVKTLQNDLAAVDATVDLPTQTVPPAVLPTYTEPDNLTRNLVPLLAPRTRFPASTDDLRVIDARGSLRRATVGEGPGVVPGQVPGCGTRVDAPGARLALDAVAFDSDWWIRIGYLSSGRSPVVVQAGDSRVRSEVRRGLHNLFVHATGSFDEILVSGLAPGTTLCVDTADVGQPEPIEDPS